MKLKLIVAVGILSTTFVIGQEKKSSKLSLGLNYGIVGSVDETIAIKSANSNSIRLNGKYMLKPNFGLMLLGGFNSFLTKDGGTTKTNIGNASIEAVYDISKLLYKKQTNFSFLIHAGPGIATMWNKDNQVSNPMDPYIKNQDEIVNLNFGFTPQFSLSSHWDINMDLSYTYNFEQNRTFNYIKSSSKTAMLYNLTLGFNYKFGNKKEILIEYKIVENQL
jgi:hypothetical protein